MRTDDKQVGLVVGIVQSLDDRKGLGRVRVTFPHLDDEQSEWAPIASPMAGDGRGMVFRPEKGEAVLVGFAHGDPRNPFVLGGFWSTEDPPPQGTDKDSDNDVRQIRSRSGHRIVLDDRKGAERIEITDKDDKRKVVIDSAKGTMEITCDGGDLTVSASTVTVKADTIELSATGNATLKAGGTLTLKGDAAVRIN